jgi:cell division protein FtsB
MLLTLLAGAAYYLVFGGVYSVFDLRALKKQRLEAVQRIDSLISRTDSLAQRGDSLASDPMAIERTAREEYGLIRDGEVLVRFREVDGEDEEAENARPERDSELDQ